jgi:hypothetical protein
VSARVAPVVVALAALGAVATAGSKRGPAYLSATVTTSDHPSIAYCVATPASGTCAARVAPPWRPACARGKKSIALDDTLSGQNGACCYVATWRRGKVAVRVVPPPRDR